MKKTLLSALFLSACTLTFAQREYTSTTVEGTHNFSQAKVPTDTVVALGYELSAQSGNLTLFGSINGGYVCGNNGYGDVAKVQRFLLNNSTLIEELIFAFGAKLESGATSSIAARLYALDGPGESNAGAVTDAPGTVLMSVDVAIADIDTAGLTIVPLPAPMYIGEDIAAGFDMTNLAAADTVGLITSQDGDVEISDYAWELWGAGAGGGWYTIFNQTSGWGIDYDMGVFLVIDNSTAGINDAGSVNGMQMSFLNGNPAQNNVLIGYTVEKDAKMAIEVMDLKGQIVHDATFGNQAAGEYRHQFDISSWSAGAYYVSMVANGQRLTKKLMVK